MIYNGHANTVTVWKYIARRKLVPMQEDEGNQRSQSNYWERRVLMCSTKVFLKEEEKKKCFFAIIPKVLSVENPMEYVPKKFKELLIKFCRHTLMQWQ